MLDGWSDLFDKEKWQSVLDEWDTDYRYYSDREIDTGEYLAWDMIDPYVTKEFLIKEYEKSRDAVVTKDCRKGCNNCGLLKAVKCFEEDHNE